MALAFGTPVYTHHLPSCQVRVLTMATKRHVPDDKLQPRPGQDLQQGPRFMSALLAAAKPRGGGGKGRVRWLRFFPSLFNWCLWGFIAWLVTSQFLGIVWNSLTTLEYRRFGRSPLSGVGKIVGTNDEPFADRDIVCLARGRSYVPMQLSQALADSKLATLVDTTGTSINGYRVVARDRVGMDARMVEHYTKVCEHIDQTIDSIHDSCDKMGYNVTRDSLRIVDGIYSNTTKAIPRALPILIIPFWDNGPIARYAIPGWDGMACTFRLDGMSLTASMAVGVLRGTPRSVRETKTTQWLKKPSGVWRNGWYEDGSGQRWSTDMISVGKENELGIKSRQFDTVTNTELDCNSPNTPRLCRNFPSYDRWGDEGALSTIETLLYYHTMFVSNGTHFGFSQYESGSERTVEITYSLKNFISNMSVFMLLFRWFVSMMVMINSYRRGLAPWQTTGIGCLSNSRTFNLLPIVLMPRAKMIMAAFWTVGCAFQGQQRALAYAWFAIYPAIVELMLVYYSMLNFAAKVAHRRMSDALFGWTVLAFVLLHYIRQPLAAMPSLALGGKVPTIITSDGFEQLSTFDLFRPSVALRMNGNVQAIFYIKIALLAVNLVPLAFSESMMRSGKRYRSCDACEIEKALALRASNCGGLGLSTIYKLEVGDESLVATQAHGPSRNQIVPNRTSSITQAISLSCEEQQIASSSVPSSKMHHVLISCELNRLGYIIFGGKYLLTFEDWCILTSLAPLRIVEKLWNHRISVFDVTKTDDAFHISQTSRLCRLDDPDLRRIPFYDVTLCAFR